MNRRTVLKGGIVLAATAHTAVAAAPAAADPLFSAIRAYQASLAEFNRLAYDDASDEYLDRLADETYVPFMNRLTDWEGPAMTREGAIEALRISMLEKDGVCGCDAAERIVLAALAYLEGGAE